jgi:hypothetical protein
MHIHIYDVGGVGVVEDGINLKIRLENLNKIRVKTWSNRNLRKGSKEYFSLSSFVWFLCSEKRKIKMIKGFVREGKRILG